MRILALETSTRQATVAALEDNRLLGQTELDPAQRTAQAFAPAIARQLLAVGWRACEVQLIVVSQGPGSFTGLRVGVTAAKTLAYAVRAEVLGVNTLQVIADQSPAAVERLDVVTDAQRRQLFVAHFRRRGEALEMVGDVQIVNNDAWLESLAMAEESGETSRETGDGEAARRWVSGVGLARLRADLPDGVSVVAEQCWSPQASTLGRVGYRQYARGRRDDLWKLVPHYYRQSAAEEKHAAQKASADGE